MKILRKETVAPTGREFYKQYLRVLNGYLGLSARELEVLAEIMYYDDKYRAIEEDRRSLLIFTKENRYEIANRLGTSYNTVNNVLSKLRSRGILKNDRLNPKIRCPHTDEIVLQFNIKRNGL